MQEEAALFGPGAHLVGTLTQPDAAAMHSPACLLFNVGITYRIGPRRLNVKLARRFAELGVVSLRFDLAGIGDSSASENRNSFREQSVLDLQSAMDFVTERTGIRQFAVIGLCSGALNGYWAAQADPRVIGLLLFDGYAYPTLKTRVIHDWVRLRTLPWQTVVRKSIVRVSRLWTKRAAKVTGGIFSVAPDRATPGAGEFQRVLDLLSARGVSILLVHSGSVLAWFNHRDQLENRFRGAAFLNRVRQEFMPEVDHLVTPLDTQQKFISVVADWVATIRVT